MPLNKKLDILDGQVKNLSNKRSETNILHAKCNVSYYQAEEC